MALIADRVLQTANTPGTGTFTLIAAPTGRKSFIAGNGAGQVFYFAEDATSWEKGIGTATAGSPDTLSRDTVLGNSLGTTAKIAFSGTTTIFCDIPAERQFHADASSVYQAQSRRITAVAAATSVSDALRMDQAEGVREIIATGPTSGSIIVVLGSGDPRIVEFHGVVPAAASQLYFRLSFDGGSTYAQGAGEHIYQVLESVGTSTPSTAGSGSGTYAPLTISSMATSFNTHGEIYLDPTTWTWRSRVASSNGTSLFQNMTAGTWATHSTPTHILIASVTSTLTSGAVRLSRRAYV